MPAWSTPLETLMDRTDVRRPRVPASSGIMNARSDATLDAALAHHPLPGENGRAPFGLGYSLSGPDDDPGAVFGHGGYGGSNGFADRRRGLALGFTRSRLNGIGSEELVRGIRRALACD